MPPVRSRSRARLIAALATVAVAVVVLVAPVPASLVERYYSRGAYLHLQRLVTPLSNLVPLALLDLASAALIVLAVIHLARLWRGSRWTLALARAGLHLAVLGAVLYLGFVAMWGLNYRRLPLEEKLEFDASRITREAARSLGDVSVRLVNDTYSAARRDDDMMQSLASPFATAQQLLQAPALAAPGVLKRSALGLYFRWAAIDGMTDPYFLEVIVNPDVLPVERPFVLAHEWAHLAGYADEAEANFVAWLTCAHGDPAARYSGWLALYAHVSGALPREDRRLLAAQLTAGPRADLTAINARLLRSAPVVRNAAREVYDSYLKANRVERGILSYDAVVRLVLGVRFDEGWLPKVRNGL